LLGIFTLWGKVGEGGFEWEKEEREDQEYANILI